MTNTRQFTADEIIRGLDGDPNTGMCMCPAHDNKNTPALHVSDGDKAVVWKCHAGCSQDAVRDALIKRGVWSSSKKEKPIRSKQQDNDAEFERRALAWDILRAALQSRAKPDAYLRGRGIKTVPANAYLLPAEEAARLTDKRYPAMVLPIVQRTPEGLRLTGAHVTFLSSDGTKNARDGNDKSYRRTYGIIKGGFIPLGQGIDDPTSPLIVGEGVETVLSAMQLHGDEVPGIAASASNMAALQHLPRASEVIIAADNDDAGRVAASQLAQRREYEGHEVRIVMPPKKRKDWNDYLRDDEEHAKQEWRTASAHEEEREESELSHPVEEFMELIFPKREMLMDPWLPQPGIAMIFARAGHGKTYIALGCAFAVANGREFLGWKCERAGRVLYIDGEMPGGYLQKRLQIYGEVPTGQLHIVSRDTFNLRHELMPDLGTQEGRRVIDSIIKRVDPDLIIIDSLSTLVRSGEESSAEDWVPVQDWMMKHRWLGRTMLMIHHAGKSGDQRGTSKRMDTPETTIKLTKQKDVEKAVDESAFELEFIKGRELFGEYEDNMMLWFAIRENTIEWRHEAKRDVLKEKVKEGLAAGTKQKDIARELEISEARVSQIKRELNEEEA